LELAGEWMSVDQVLDVVGRDAVYYESSGGGVTFSGGEPTAQPDFLEACARRCRSEGFHTALDTCGYVEWEVMAKILPHIDLFLFDLKHMDSERHKQLTGVSSGLIHENLRRINSQGKAIWIRIPLIPGCNDSDENLREMAEMVRPLQSVRRVSILPYNSAAGAHYEMIGQVFPLDDVDSLDGREQRALQIFASANINAELD
jgi:pyruvate formate lyase activating enzyme